MSWVIEHSKQKGSSFVVLLMIANHAHSDGTNAFPSYDTIARESRISHRQVTRIIPKLEASGELVIDRHGGPSLPNKYTIPLSRDILSRQTRQGGRDIRDPKCPSNRKEPNTEPKDTVRFILTPEAIERQRQRREADASLWRKRSVQERKRRWL